MPRVYAPRRPHIGYREDADVLTLIDALAAAEGVERSDVLRAATRVYTQNKQRPGRGAGGGRPRKDTT